MGGGRHRSGERVADRVVNTVPASPPVPVPVQDAGSVPVAWDDGWRLRGASAPNQVGLAGDLVVLMHDARSGRLRVADSVAGLGVAGALLAGLVAAGRVELRRGLVVVVDASPVPDPVGSGLLARIASERGRLPVSTWLTFAGHDGLVAVVDGLVGSELMRWESGRRGLRRVPTSLLVDRDGSAALSGLLYRELKRRRRPEPGHLVLAGLADAVGLLEDVLWDATTADRERVNGWWASLPGSVRWVLAETRATVGNATLTGRI